jgi:hypothetical protein
MLISAPGSLRSSVKCILLLEAIEAYKNSLGVSTYNHV